jgi:hypothetical protein
MEGLKQLSCEVDALAAAVYKELYPLEDRIFFNEIRQRFLAERV